jgi:hypothetical protein
MHISLDSKITKARISHSFKCPLGGGFWLDSEEHGRVGCDENGNPLCQCSASIVIEFANGTSVTVGDGHSLLRCLSGRPSEEEFAWWDTEQAKWEEVNGCGNQADPK